MDTTIKAGHEKRFLPAAGHDFFLPFYDLVTKIMGADRIRSALARRAELRPGQRVLDIGCGTGTLVILLKQLYPEVDVAGLDPDAKALERAKRKAHRAGVSVRLDKAFADSIPYQDGDFDAVFSTFMFHHLDVRTKGPMLAEARRVLKPGCRLNLLDFGGPDSAKSSSLSRRLHSHHRLKENAEGSVLALMGASGLVQASIVERRTVLFGLGHVVYYRALAPADDQADA